jgi:hypothetical protein
MLHPMRSTVRIDDDLMTALKTQAARENVSLTRVLNRALRAGIGALARDGKPKEPFEQRTVSLGTSSFDLTKALDVSTTLEDEESLHELALRK